MEFTPSKIARLVLGYLKKEKCHETFDSFFKTSPHFSYNGSNKQSKYVVTRVLGYNLQDILNEYTQIYNLIQERLEPTAYYDDNASKNIIDQLTYLLDNGCHTRQNTPQRSMSSTPIKDINKRYFLQHNLSVIEENVSPELNTTPLEALPGNSQEFNNNISKRRCGIKTNKNTAVEESDSGDSPDNSQEDTEGLEVLRQTLLEHPELHEKIAENINLIINTGESNTKSTDDRVCNELNSAIKAIVERTEADPIFEKLIGDLICSTSEDGEINKIYLEQKQSDFNSVPALTNMPQSSCSTLQTSDNVPQCSENLEKSSNITQETPENNSESIKCRLRSPKKQTPVQVEQNKKDVSSETKIVQTEELLSINRNIQTNDNTKQMEITSDVHRNLTVNTNTGDIILYEGTLDNYVKSSTPPTVNPVNPILYNNNLLMVQPGIAIQQPAMAAPLLNTIQIDKPYYLLNNSQFINVSVPQYNVNNVTEQDILNMPTVIVCDDNQQVIPNRTAKSLGPKEAKKILPKQAPESSIREYLSLYQCGDQDVTEAPAKTKPKLQKKKASKTQSIQIEILKPPYESADHLPALQDEIEAKTDTSEEKPSSPRPVTPEASKHFTRKSTPKSGSHVRALDFNFNTPSHKKLSARKNRTSSMSPKKNSPSKLSTKISKSLFCSPSKNAKVENEEDNPEPKETTNQATIAKCKEPTQKKMGSWDSDLRALAGPTRDTSLPRRKRRESGKRSARKSKANLNATETDAKAIEESLRAMDLEIQPSNTEVVKEEPVVVDVLIKEQDTKVEVKEDVPEVKVNKVEHEDGQGSEFTMTVINCNAKAKFKKKCNIDNNISKAVKITKVKEIKSLELVPDGSNKLILSPSKLNANKRTLVENADKEINLIVSESADSTAVQEMNLKLKVYDNPVAVCDKQDAVDIKPTNIENKNVETKEEAHENEKKEDGTDKESGKFTTPEMPNISNPYPVSANRNLMPLLETPLKYIDTPMKLEGPPKTPGAYIPHEISPMTKILNEQLQGVDLLSIETPKFPLTPSFPITPFNSTKSPYPHRSTDYSTASSYYQPSDNEQNKSLEAILEECKRLSNPSPEKEEEKLDPSVTDENAISQKIRSFNQSQIGRKNLNLVEKDLEGSSTSCDSSSSDDETSSSNDDDSSSSESAHNKSINETITTKKTENPYMLRSKKKEENSKAEKTATIQDIVTQAKIKPELEKTAAVIAKETILKEVEEKRKRTIAKFKEVEKPRPNKKGPTKPPKRDSSGKYSSKSPPSTVASKLKSSASRVNKRKSKSPVKVTQKPKKDIGHTAEEEKNVTLHISSDDEQIKPFDVVETELLESSSSSFGHPLNTFQKTLDSLKLNMQAKESNENISDQEAASLVEGLKERGIYLVPNKTPKKQEKSNTISVTSKENHVTVETKRMEEQINQSVAVQKNAVNSSDEKLEKNCITPGEIAGITDAKSTSETKEIKSDNPSNSTLPKESLTKETNKRKSTIPKSIQRRGSKDEKYPKIPNGVSAAKSKKMPGIKSDSASCNKSKSHKLDIQLDNAINSILEEADIFSVDQNKKDGALSKDKKHKPVTKTPSKSKSRETKNGVSSKPSKPSQKKPSDKESDKKMPGQDCTEKNVVEKLNTEKLNSQVAQGKLEPPNDSDKVKDLKSPAIESQKINDTSTQCSTVEHDLNLTDSFIDEVVFDNKFYFEETLIKVVYDQNKVCSKTLKDYDLPISNKSFVVEVFDQQVEMSVTPFETLLNIPEKKCPDRVKILQNTLLSTGKRKSPLNILYGRLTESTSNMKTISPLENLYDENNTTERFPCNKAQKLKRNRKRVKSVDQKIFEFKPSVKRNTRSKSLDYRECALEECTTVNSAIKSDELDRLPGKHVTKDFIESSSSTPASARELDDDLMNYAVCGSERTENDSDSKVRVHKRKAKDEIDDASFKKTKREDLLKYVNVDVFLTQLHGDNN